MILVYMFRTDNLKKGSVVVDIPGANDDHGHFFQLTLHHHPDYSYIIVSGHHSVARTRLGVLALCLNISLLDDAVILGFEC